MWCYPMIRCSLMTRTPEQRARHAEAQRRYRAENPERVREIDRRAREKRMADPERAAAAREYQRVKQAKYRALHPEKRSATQRRSEMIRRFGITPERYAEMLAAQSGLCQICKDPPKPTKRLCIDHDHSCCAGQIKTCGRCVRGLLCDRCNRGMGLFGDDPVVLAAVIEYLTQWVPA